MVILKLVPTQANFVAQGCRSSAMSSAMTCCCKQASGVKGVPAETVDTYDDDAKDIILTAPARATKERELKIAAPETWEMQAQRGQECKFVGLDKARPATQCKETEEYQSDEKFGHTSDHTCQFTIYLHKNTLSEPLGISLKTDDSGGGELVVDAPTGQPVAQWNLTYPELRVRPGDQIMSVNNVTGPGKELLEELRADLQSFQIVMRRALLITVSTVKRSTFGLRVSFKTMEVLEIGPGIVATYNLTANPAKEIYVGDTVFKVNGQTGDPAELLAAMQNCKDGERVSLSFSRPMAVFSSQLQKGSSQQ